MDALFDAALLHHRSGRLEAAEAMYRMIVEASSSHVPACVHLARLLMRRGGFDEAIRWLRWAVAEAPHQVDTYRHLGLAYASSRQLDDALDAFSKVLEHEPDDVGTLQIVANLQQALGHAEAARATFLRTHALQPLLPIAASRQPPEFRALLLFAPGAGNTPIDFLIEGAPFESLVLNVLPDVDHDCDRLRDAADVVVNLVADVDLGHGLLSDAARLAERIGHPVVNEPDRVALTDRETVARRLLGIEGCVVPHVRRHSEATLERHAQGAGSVSMPYPLLVRPAGSHGGVDFHKVRDGQHLAAVLQQTDAARYYVTQYVDYRSSDGYFRKYRFLFVGDDILPYHLAIGDMWKVHHATTDMIDHPWMQEEERVFLGNPRTVFGAAQFAALHAIRQRIGLDYFGVDCALDRSGRVVVFEVNACMLVHGHNAAFPYKTLAVNRIREAFHALLRRKAMCARREMPATHD
ncbi:Tetratricopeptide repeat protein [Pararobbsia alpina]